MEKGKEDIKGGMTKGGMERRKKGRKEHYSYLFIQFTIRNSSEIITMWMLEFIF